MLQAAFKRFNRGFDWLSNGYGTLTRRLIRATVVMLVLYVGLVALTGVQFARTPTGFIPEQDQGYLITVVQLPPGATLDRTEAVVEKAIEIILDDAGHRACRTLRRAGCHHVHRRVQRRHDLLGPALALQSRHRGRDGELGARRPAPAPFGHPGRLRPDHSAAAGAGPRQRRRLQDDAPGSGRRWAPTRSPSRLRPWSPLPTRIPPLPASSRCSARARPRSTPTSTG